MSKISAVKLATFTAMTLVLSAPSLALAKAPEASVRHSLAKPLANHIIPEHPGNHSTKIVETGKIDSTANGEGTWNKNIYIFTTILGLNKKLVTTEVYDTITYKNGVVVYLDDVSTKNLETGAIKSKDITDYYKGSHLVSKVVSDDTITKNAATGAITSDDAIHYSNGGTVVKDLTYSAVKDGAQSITGTIKLANGSVEDLSGTKTKESYGYDTSDVITNSKGKKEDINNETLLAGNVTNSATTVTGFNGKTTTSDTESDMTSKKVTIIP